MTEKEKAEAYDEALKKASAAHKDEDKHLKATLERIFPELKESKDEKIKTAILNNPSNTGKNEPKFKVGDWIVDNCSYVWKIEGILNQFYILEGVEGGESRPTIDWVDKTFHLWTIEDAKDGDVLACNEEILLFKSYSVQGRISLYCWYNGQTNNFHSKEVIDISLNKRNKVYPATKEQRDTFMKIMNDAGYEWNDETKTLEKLVKPKFMVGDMIRHKDTNKDDVFEIIKVYCDSYGIDGFPWLIYMENQDQYELVTNKFDPKTLKPLDRVLVKNDSSGY